MQHPLSWHDGVKAVVRGKTRKGRKKVLCRCNEFKLIHICCNEFI
jgi:hypothetical protein